MASYDPRDAEKLHELHQPAAPRLMGSDGFSPSLTNFQRGADMICEKLWVYRECFSMF